MHRGRGDGDPELVQFLQVGVGRFVLHTPTDLNAQPGQSLHVRVPGFLDLNSAETPNSQYCHHLEVLNIYLGNLGRGGSEAL